MPFLLQVGHPVEESIEGESHCGEVLAQDFLAETELESF